MAPVNPVSGTAGSVAYVSGGTTTVAGVHEWNLDIGRDTPEITAFGDSMRAYVQGIGEWSGSFMLHNDAGDASQALVRNLIVGGSAALPFRFYAGTQYYSGSIFINGSGPEMAYDGVFDTSYDFQGSGPLSYTG